MKPGDICLHNTNTIHRSGPNTTNKSRRQLGLIYRSSRAKRVKRPNTVQPSCSA
jgi:ectoine hydroxylase-related dioxygenase (phytanoyl-CoA dioxygenase family)